MSDDLKKEQKSAQVLVLDTLNDLFNKCAAEDDQRRAISISAVVIYSDGTSSQEMAGDLDRIKMTGLLTDLVNQIFWQCKQMQINEAVEQSVQKLLLSEVPTDNTKPN